MMLGLYKDYEHFLDWSPYLFDTPKLEIRKGKINLELAQLSNTLSKRNISIEELIEKEKGDTREERIWGLIHGLSEGYSEDISNNYEYNLKFLESFLYTIIRMSENPKPDGFPVKNPNTCELVTLAKRYQEQAEEYTSKLILHSHEYVYPNIPYYHEDKYELNPIIHIGFFQELYKMYLFASGKNINDLLTEDEKKEVCDKRAQYLIDVENDTNSFDEEYKDEENELDSEAEQQMIADYLENCCEPEEIAYNEDLDKKYSRWVADFQDKDMFIKQFLIFRDRFIDVLVKSKDDLNEAFSGGADSLIMFLLDRYLCEKKLSFYSDDEKFFTAIEILRRTEKLLKRLEKE